MLTGHATVLLAPDVRATLDWYRDRLGFAVDVYRDGEYGYASRDACHLHFYPCADVRPNRVAVPPDLFDAYVWVDDVDALDDELRRRDAELLHGPRAQEYGLRELRLLDPSGYVLAFGKPL